MLKRRDFLMGCGSAAVMAGLGTGTALGTSDFVLDNPGEALGPVKTQFLPLVGQWLMFSSDDRQQKAFLQLVEIADGPSDALLEQFRLVFGGRKLDRPLREGCYDALTRTRDRFQFFLKPTASDSSRQFFVAEFSLLK